MNLVVAPLPAGLIGYRDGQPVGWVSFGPREQFAKLDRSPVMKPVDAQPVWSVVCFVVPAAHRGQGVAAALLQAAAGFEEVARRKPQRPVVRLALSGASPDRCSAGSAPPPPGGASRAARRGSTRR